jgi:hypothetical protein
VSVKRGRDEDDADEAMEDAEVQGNSKSAKADPVEGGGNAGVSPTLPDLLAPRDGDCIVYVRIPPQGSTDFMCNCQIGTTTACESGPRNNALGELHHICDFGPSNQTLHVFVILKPGRRLRSR